MWPAVLDVLLSWLALRVVRPTNRQVNEFHLEEEEEVVYLRFPSQVITMREEKGGPFFPFLRKISYEDELVQYPDKIVRLKRTSTFK